MSLAFSSSFWFGKVSQDHDCWPGDASLLFTWGVRHYRSVPPTWSWGKVARGICHTVRLGILWLVLINRAHPWFADIDWDKLINLELEPPFVPNVKSAEDVGNIDDEFLEEVTRYVLVCLLIAGCKPRRWWWTLRVRWKGRVSRIHLCWGSVVGFGTNAPRLPPLALYFLLVFFWSLNLWINRRVQLLCCQSLNPPGSSHRTMSGDPEELLRIGDAEGEFLSLLLFLMMVMLISFAYPQVSPEDWFLFQTWKSMRTRSCKSYWPVQTVIAESAIHFQGSRARHTRIMSIFVGSWIIRCCTDILEQDKGILRKVSRIFSVQPPHHS